MKHLLAVAFAAGALAAATLWPASSLAYDTFYDANCAQCHGPTRTCSGCHAHGTHNLANKQDFGLTATSNKASYAAGEDVVVSVGGGYRCGWVRMQLLDATMKELAKSSGPGGLGNGPDSCNGTIPTPLVLHAPAPTTPGTYTWYAAWYGNKFDLTERGVTTTVFGPNFKDGPGAGHGRELIPVSFTVVAGGAPVAAIPSSSLVFPTVPVGATASISTSVQNSGTAVLQVNSIARCDANALPFSWKAKTPFSIAPGGAFSLPVTYQPTSAVTSTTCLNLATNDPANPTMQVSLSGAATPAPAGTPAISTSATSLSFGTGVLAGTFATQTFQVQSVGTANLSVTSIDPCPGSTMFAGRSDDLPGIIAPGEARTVTVTYTPTAAGTNNGCVTISTNGGVATVNASGAAIMPAVTCTSCHGGKDNQTGAPPTDTAGETATTRMGVGAHSAHLNTQISPIVAQQATDCTACHESVVAFTDPKHRDGSTDVPFGGVSKMSGAAGNWNPATPTCGTVYCHGGTLANAGGTNTAPTWTNVGAGEAACGRCHGIPPTTNGHPVVTGGLTACVSCHPETMTAAGTLDPAGKHIDGIIQAAGCTSCHGSAANPAPPKDTLGNTATTFPGVGAHQSHVTGSNISPAFGCSDCHGAQVASYTSGHKNGVVDMGFSALAGTSSAFNTTTLSCASTYCHGNFKNGNTANAPTWTGTFTAGTTSLACNSCHGTPPGGTHPANANCGSCHTGYTATTANVSLHVNGVVDVVNLTCSSCHGDVTRVAVAGGETQQNMQAVPPLDSKGNSATTFRGVGVHQAHVSGARSKPQLCSACHTVPTTTTHSDGVVQVAMTAGAFNTTTLTCASTYCHGNFTGGASATTPAWTAAGALACTACHGNPPALPHPQSTACADCHGAGYSSTTVNQATHIDGAVTLPTTAHVSGTCTACHGDSTKTVLASADANAKAAPPVGTRSETLATTKAVGAHTAHLNQTTLRSAPIACTECHAVPAAGDKTHANGTAAVTFGTLAKTGAVTPAYNTTALTCASTWCHGNFKNGNTTNAPSWTGGVAQAGCTSCHGSPPTGTHPVNTTCANCHSGYTATSVNPATHINGVVDVINMTCASCHGDATRVAVAGGETQQNMQAVPPLDSKGNSAVTARGVGVHQVHVSGARSKPQLCSECHVVPTTTSHSDGLVQVAFAKGGTFDGTALSCASTYCHGNFTGGAGTTATPAWTTAGTLGCASCHGNPPALPHPQDTSCADCHGAGYSSTTVNQATHIDGAVTLPTTQHVAASCTACHGDNTKTVLATADANARAAPAIGSKGETVTTAKAVGAHAAHLNQTTFRSAPLACTDCHTVPAAGDKTHANGTAAVTFGTLAKTGGVVPAYSTTAFSCATVYCHGGTTGGTVVVQGGTNTTPVWTGTFTAGASTLGCTSCHGAPPTANGHPQRTDCGTCHTGATNTAYNSANHINGVVDVIATLSCTTCHGSAALVAVAGADANAKAAPPVDTKNNTATTFAGVGVHQVHVNGSRSKPVACAECHSGAVPTTPQHENGVVTVAFGTVAKTGAVTPTYPTSGGSCSATYCHGNFTGGAGAVATPTWVTAGTLGCASCHGNPPALPHPQDTSCADCHGAGYSQTTVNAATHVDGTVTLPTTQHVAASCTACHGDATKTVLATADANARAAPPIGSKGETATTAKAVGAHVAHLNQTTFRSAPLACTDCHTVPAAGDKTHANGTALVTFGTLAKTGGVAAAYNTTALSCASVYCHGGTTAVQGGTATTPVWTGTFTAGASTMTCTSCHGAPPTANGHVQRTDCGSCHTGATNTAYNAATHINGSVDIGSMTCTSCHGSATLVAVAGADANVKASPPVDSKNNAAVTAVGVGVHQVHVNGSRSKPVACAACHNGAVPTTTTGHTKGTTTVAFAGVATTGSVVPTYTVGTGGSCNATYCHGNFTGGAGAVATPSWITAGTLACTACHGNPPALPHPQDTSCADCHGAGYSQTTVNAATHVDGAVTLPTTAHVAGSCTACHGTATVTVLAGADANTPAAPPIGSKGETATTTRAVGAHQLHVNSNTYRNPVACTECHTVPAAGDKTHANGTAAITFGTAAKTGGVTPAWNTTAFTCASTYCHGNFNGGKKTYTPTWTAANTTTTCGTCHGLPPSATEDPNHPAVAAGGSCSGCHTGYNATTAGGTVNLTNHMNGVVDAAGGESAGGAACSGCHGTIYNSMIASSTKASKHTLGSDAAADITATSWTGTNLAAVATTGRSCVSMCHQDHPHGTTTHNANVYMDATTSTTRTSTKLATDFDSTQTTGGLCTSCHQKPVDAASPAAKPAVAKATFQNTAHDFKSNTVGTTTYTWQYTLHDNSAFQRDCTKCHASQAEGQTPTVAANGSGTVGPHASDFGQLLAGNTVPGTTPANLICYNCHGDNTVGKNMSGKVIYTDAAKTQGHGTKINSATVHSTANEAAATYNSGAYSGTNRHVVCLDCHDEHMAGKTKHTVGPNDGTITASSPLNGASGVAYTGTLPANFAAIPSTNLAKVAVATAEYQICFKCHTGWAFGTTPPTGPSTLAETDLAQEFNVNNKAAHPVVNTLANQTGSTAKGLVAAQLLAPWNVSPGAQTMTCSDCHNTDAASTAAQGPHGSAVTFMLTGTNRAWPYTVAGATTGTLYKLSSSETGVGTANGLFCRNCHPQQNSTGSNSLHRNSNLNGGQHGNNANIPACTGCHLRIPHGGKVSRLLVTTPAPTRYKVGTSNFAQITKGATKDSYSTSSFPSGFKSSCSEHSSGTGNETW